GPGFNKYRRPKVRTAIPAPTEARRNRDASACISNCHHSSLEYSTCLNENVPRNTDAATTATTAANQGADHGSSNTAALRSNERRAATRATRIAASINA